jgi:hypothetical protein
MDFEFSNGIITKYTGSATEVVIPDTIKGQKVTGIGRLAFWTSDHSLTSVNIPSGVTKIGEMAFYQCVFLTSVNIPSSVTTIGEQAFDSCGNLTSLNIPPSVTMIGKKAFNGCRSLTSVNIPSSVTTLEDDVFGLCKSLTSVNIPSSVTAIGEGAFHACRSLTSVHIPSGVTTIRGSTFLDCESLVSISIPSSVTAIAEGAFEGCDALDSASREAIRQHSSSGGCYIATAVYGSYNCPQVWALRRYRDFTLAESLFGRAFIRVYYAVSPTLVKWFGKKTWFNHLWHGILDRKVRQLRNMGIEDTLYVDRAW